MAQCGTHTQYCNGCRCDECRSAATAYQRERKAIRKANVIGGEAWHGTLGGHSNYGCRCDACRSAYREYKRGYVRRNREKVNAQARTAYARDPERHIAAVQRYQCRNREQYLDQQRRYRQANPEKLRAKNSRRRATLASVVAIPFTAEQLAQRWAYYGNRCWICGETADSTDHIKPIAKGGAHMLANLRPICTPCNSRKRDQWPYVPEVEAA